jgi:hypothetical protein
VSIEADERSGRPSTTRTAENIEKLRELIHEARRRTIHELADAVGISYGVCQVIVAENLNIRHTVHHDNTLAHTSLKTIESVTNNNMVIVPHPPYSPDLVACDFALFPKLIVKLKGRRFETVSDIHKKSQAVLDSVKENDFHGASEACEK